MQSSEILSSPIGKLQIIAVNDAIVEVKFIEESSPNLSSPSPLTSECARQLEEYFNGQRETFDLRINLQGSKFQTTVWNELLNIPYGNTITYSDLSIKIGDIKAIRAVAAANGKNKIPIIIPCHRVIGRDGSLTGYLGGIDKKKWLLEHEGAISTSQLSIQL